ncbi:hypothetical protein AALO_G00065790 [Alosa alosa]|uniref:Tripartite motif-containing protein 16-like n=1 Tax=Alosa alosa TaxID=278164 RepID=A0AAV6H1E4_9TELE|nr:E3 ubiquitin-protein ligase TRIM11-like [Alosa alosa]KAG5280950.1 hypothetical protein AALO_G00065790 [Alosa alosa]
MADAFLKEQDSFFCPICLDLLRDPVAIPCGHNYCMGCISSYWNQDEQRGCYSCPQCRQTSPQRPVLNKNPLIAQLVDRVRAKLTAASSAHRCFHPGHVKCEFRSGDKRRSVRRCAADASSSDSASGCCASGEVRPEGQHEGLDAVEQLRDICSHSQKLLDMFCHSQQQCLCYPSSTDEHTGLQVGTTTAETTGKQRHFHKYHAKSHQRIQEREKELQELRKAVETLKLSAQAAVEKSERIYSDLLRSIERRAEEKAKLQQAEELLRRLQEEIEVLRKEPRLGQRSLSHHTTHLPQSSQSVCDPRGSKGAPTIMVNQHFAFDEVKQSVTDLRERLDNFLIKVQSVLPPEPETRDEFLQYSRPLTLDPNTVHRELCLSEGNRRVTHCDEYQSYPSHPERFDGWEQVLCREGASGRCYWEVEWSGEEVSIAVSYKDISRKGHGHECGFGSNDQSWSLDCSKSALSFRHDNKETELPRAPSSYRIGVYVDHRAGTLAFYSMSDTITLLHRVQTTFIHTLYPGFWLGFNFHHGQSSVKLL